MLQGDGLTALGNRGSSLGYDDLVSPGDSIQNSLAIEFDTYEGGAYDPNDNHIAVLTGGSVVTNPPLAVATPGFDLNDGLVYNVWIDYNLAGDDLLGVYIDDASGGFAKPGAPILTYTVQLDGVLGGASAYAGFSGATGGLFNSHDILEWEMSTSASSPSDALTLTIDADSVSEEAGAAATTATVTRAPGTSGALTVNLFSSDTSEVTVPATVIIPDTQNSVTFELDAVPDGIADGAQTVTITAAAAGYTAGADTVHVTDDDAGGATIFGTAGADTITPAGVSAGVTGGLPSNANDTITAGGGADTVDGGGGNDSIDGGADGDSLIGGEGDDTLRGGYGFDTLDGGGGNDTADISHTTAGPAITLGEGGGNGSVLFPGGVETLIGIENVMGSLGDNDITGNSGANDLKGNDGNDSIDGLGGDDTVDGGAGADTFVLRAGDGADDVVNFEDGIDSFFLAGGLTFGALTIAPDRGDALISVTSGGEVLARVVGRAGTVGIDDFLGQGGANITGTSGGDTITPTGVSAGVTGGIPSGGDDTIDALGGDDTVDGGDGSDFIDGGNGADSIVGGAGDDTLKGGFGYDTLDGGPGIDTADISHTSAGPAITLAEAGLTGSVDFGVGLLEALIDIENVIGSLGDDEITGNSEANDLQGNNGNDIIDGLGGADTLAGGAGADGFVLRQGDGIDTIAEYVDGTDKFLLDGLVFGDLNFVAAGPDIEIRIDATDEVLAIVEGIGTGLFDSADFDQF